MIDTVSDRRADPLVAHAMFAVAMIELLMRDAYHRTSAEALKQVLVVVAWTLVALLLLASMPRRREMGHRAWPARVAVLVGLVAVGDVMLGIALRGVASSGAAGLAMVWALVGGLALGSASLLRTTTANWCRWRNALATAAIIFLASQPALALLHAPAIAWPPAAQGTPVPRTATVFLLLDELDASLAPAFVDRLQAAGYDVRHRGVRPVGPNTITVVPQMFAGVSFNHPKPCGPSAICSAAHVLDFARVSASRPDVDVVGFYHPYCALRGLRWCERLEAEHVLLDADRWGCALWRRVGVPRLDPQRCDAAYNRVWQRLRDRALEAFWRAPVWHEGGFLFAHLPLPHPPGATRGGSLDLEYLGNAANAVDLVQHISERLRDAGLAMRLVIFSDHPLRRAQWCGEYAPYVRTSACAGPARAQEYAVPVIVAGAQPPAIDDIVDNGAVFEIAARWR